MTTTLERAIHQFSLTQKGKGQVWPKGLGVLKGHTQLDFVLLLILVPGKKGFGKEGMFMLHPCLSTLGTQRPGVRQLGLVFCLCYYWLCDGQQVTKSLCLNFLTCKMEVREGDTFRGWIRIKRIRRLERLESYMVRLQEHFSHHFF